MSLALARVLSPAPAPHTLRAVLVMPRPLHRCCRMAGAFFRHHLARRMILVLGDSVTDIDAAHEVPYDEILSVGFLNSRVRLHLHLPLAPHAPLRPAHPRQRAESHAFRRERASALVRCRRGRAHPALWRSLRQR